MFSWRKKAQAPVPALNIIVDDALYAKQQAVMSSLAWARRWQWAARLSIRVCFLLAARALGYLSPWIATWPEGWNDTGHLLLVITQIVCVTFGFWTWTDRIFANMFHETARHAYESRMKKLGYAEAGPEFVVDMMRLQMRLAPEVAARAGTVEPGESAGGNDGNRPVPSEALK